ncbi:MAG: hypothetical protein H5T64_11465 [Chloroflexi bacterium]|nr:hypothetical protein [Chloroflexota bacterium]
MSWQELWPILWPIVRQVLIAVLVTLLGLLGYERAVVAPRLRALERRLKGD